eukprot:1613915-Rhodomonas_salina.1
MLLPLSYAVSGPEIGYAATRRRRQYWSMSASVLRYWPTRALCNCYTDLLRGCYAMSGTERAAGAVTDSAGYKGGAAPKGASQVP